MGNMSRATKQIKQNKRDQLLNTIAQRVDYDSQTIFRLSIRAESIIKLLIDKGIITKEEFDEEIKKSFEDEMSKQNPQNDEQTEVEQSEEPKTE